VAEPDRGTVAVGQRADLLLLEASPLEDIRNTRRLVGVMLGGRWIGPAERATLLGRVEAFAAGQGDPFPGLGPLDDGTPGTLELAATYAVHWRGARFGTERVRVLNSPGGQTIRAQGYDPHKGQGMTLTLVTGGSGPELRLESDGAAGRGRAEVRRRGEQALLSGQLLSGVSAVGQVRLPEEALLGAAAFLASQIPLRPRLTALAVGQRTQVTVGELALGSSLALPVRTLVITRTKDVVLPGSARPGAARPERVARRFEISAPRPARKAPSGAGRSPAPRPSPPRPPAVLLLDGEGWPLAHEFAAHGGRVRYERLE
jgi:hypothetical protein